MTALIQTHFLSFEFVFNRKFYKYISEKHI